MTSPPPQPDSDANRKKALKVAGISAGALGGGVLLVLVVSSLLPVLGIVLLVAMIAGPSLFAPSDAALQGKIDASIKDLSYTTLPSYKADSADIGVQPGTCFIGCSPSTARASIEYTDESVAQLARKRLDDAGWHCKPLRTVLPARERAVELFGTPDDDSSCTKFNRLPVSISFLEPGKVEIYVSSDQKGDWTATSDFDYCTGFDYLNAHDAYELSEQTEKICAPYVERKAYFDDNCLESGGLGNPTPQEAAKYRYGFCNSWKPGTPDVNRYPEFADVSLPD